MAGEGPKAARDQPSVEGNPALPHSTPSSSPVPPGFGVMQHPAKTQAVNCSSPNCSVCLGTAALSTLEGPRAAAPPCCATWILGDRDPQGLCGAPWGSYGTCCLLSRADRQGWHWAQHHAAEGTLPGMSPQPAWDRILYPLCSEQGEGIPPCLQNGAAASHSCRRWGKRLVVSKAVEIFLACRLLLSLAISLGSSLSRHTGNNWGCSARPQAVDQQRE